MLLVGVMVKISLWVNKKDICFKKLYPLCGGKA